MSLFYNPQKSGSGVSKEQSEKKPFTSFFELFGRKFWYLMQLNFIYLVFCIPVITIGPATAALTQVMRKFVLEQPIFVFSEFFSTFKKNFRIGTVLVGLFSPIFLVTFTLSMFTTLGAVLSDTPNNQAYFALAMNIVSGIVFLTINLYIYPQIVCLNLGLRSVIRNSLLLSVVGFKRNAITLLSFALVFSVMYYLISVLSFLVVMLLFFPFAQLAFIGVFNVYPVIQKYIINPYYKESGEKNPEIPDYNNPINKKGEKSKIFIDLGGKETPINKKNVKTSGKLIK